MGGGGNFIVILFLGYLGANFPLLNFFNYYYFGQQKFGINLGNPFIFNEWLEKVSWRGFFSSAETAYFNVKKHRENIPENVKITLDKKT